MSNLVSLTLPASEATSIERSAYLADPFITARLHDALVLAFEIHAQDPEFQREWSRTSGLTDQSSFDVMSKMVRSVWCNRSRPSPDLKPDDQEAIEFAVSLLDVFDQAIEWIIESREEGAL